MQKRILLVGNGFMGGIHAANLQQYGADTHIISNGYNIHAVLASGIYNGAIIATPFDQHYKLASEIIEKNIPLLIEKPLCYDFHHAADLVRKAEEQHVLLFSGQILRFFPCMQKLSQIIASGTYGDINSIECVRHADKSGQVKSWWASLKRFLLPYEAIHTIDWLLHNVPTNDHKLIILDADVIYSNKYGMAGDTSFSACLRSPEKNILISLNHDMFSKHSKNEMVFNCAQGQIKVTDFSSIEVNGIPLYTSAFEEEFNQAAATELKNFLNCLEFSFADYPSGKSSLAALKIIDDLYTYKRGVR